MLNLILSLPYIFESCRELKKKKDMPETNPQSMKSESLGLEMSLHVRCVQARQVFLVVARAENHSFTQRDKCMSGL